MKILNDFYLFVVFLITVLSSGIFLMFSRNLINSLHLYSSVQSQLMRL